MNLLCSCVAFSDLFYAQSYVIMSQIRGKKSLSDVELLMKLCKLDISIDVKKNSHRGWSLLSSLAEGYLDSLLIDSQGQPDLPAAERVFPKALSSLVQTIFSLHSNADSPGDQFRSTLHSRLIDLVHISMRYVGNPMKHFRLQASVHAGDNRI